MKRPVIILGGGGHGRVVVDALRAAEVPILGYTSPTRGRVQEVEWLGDDGVIADYAPDGILLANGLGSVGNSGPRQRLFERFVGLGYTFATVVHPAAIISTTAPLAKGAQVMAGAVLQAGVYVGKNTIINTRATVDHDCRIGDHAHLAPGVVLSGDVQVGDAAHVGTGASVIQGIRLGPRCLVAAGAVVVRDVDENQKVMGVPAKVVWPT